jgi:hypothetical protein
MLGSLDEVADAIRDRSLIQAQPRILRRFIQATIFS